MLSFEDYKKMKKASTLGGIRKQQSDMIMEATWDGDIQTKTMYLFDYYHDPEKYTMTGLDIKLYKELPVIRAKYIIGTYQSLDKDTVPFKIQLLPSQDCNVSYYKEIFEDRYSAMFPIGLYVALPDEKGNYNKWLIVDKADAYAPQFPTYQILPCDYALTWMDGKKKCKMCGCLRSQNS